MSSDIPVIDKEAEPPELPKGVRCAIILPTYRWNNRVRSLLGVLLGIANEEVAVLISDNSENKEKRDYLKKIRSINPNIFCVAQKTNIGAAENFFFLWSWARNIDYIAQAGDDDFFSQEYFLEAYSYLTNDSNASAAETGTALLDLGNHQFQAISQPSITGSTPLHRIQKWRNVPRITMYNMGRKKAIAPAISYLKDCPLHSTTLAENIIDLSRLCFGNFISLRSSGFYAHYPSTLGNEENYYRLFCQGRNIDPAIIYFFRLFTVIHSYLFLTGTYSPIENRNERLICGETAFKYLYVDFFINFFAAHIKEPVLMEFLIKHHHLIEKLQYFTSVEFVRNIFFSKELLDFYFELLKALDYEGHTYQMMSNFVAKVLDAP